jgi:hypothetical protein
MNRSTAFYCFAPRELKGLITFLLLTLSFYSFGQSTAIVYGTVTDAANRPVEQVTVSVFGLALKPASTDRQGNYELQVPADTTITIVFSNLSFRQKRRNITANPGDRIHLNQSLQMNTMDTVEVVTSNRIESPMMRLPTINEYLPSSTGDFNAILFTQPGVYNKNELSSQYSVRGGNFDENLVYVNDIEVYRPFLIRSGQQEGLSFVNSDLVSGILFSAGGFDAKYGDKMSSVLDIQYRRPRELAGTVSASLLGTNIHLEGTSESRRFTWLMGARYKSNKYVLGSLDTDGDYKPRFTDVQAFLTYDISDVLEIDVLGNVAENKFRMIPQTRETSFGTLNEALRLKVYFDGQEVDQFNTSMGALSAIYHPDNETNIKFIASAFHSKEYETYDILGEYYIDELENDFGKETFGQVAFNRGIGAFLEHGRNYLDAYVLNAEHKGTKTKGRNQTLWGVKYQREMVEDRLSEWKMIDSAGYSLPQADPLMIELQDVYKTVNILNSNRYSGYFQKIWNKELKDTSLISFTAGIRSNFWDVNDQFLVSPRTTLSWKPRWKKTVLIDSIPTREDVDVVFRFSAGVYHQPPFYRELRDLEGQLHTDVKAQTSVHFVAGSDLNFKAWNRPFKFVSEIYYKYLDNIIPYEVDNVRIRYYANNNARGYATGVDMKVNGQFVNGVESWVSMSFMQTREDIKDDYYYKYYNSDGEEIIKGYTQNSAAIDSVRYEPGFLPRPTDQRINFGLFFQDKMPRFPDFRMHLNLLFGTGVPFGPPSFERYKDTLRMPPYRRVDIGFSYQLVKEDKKIAETSIFHNLKSVWIGLEVFNLLQVNNTISYFWIKDVTDRQYAIPNYLTSRQLNLRMMIKF